MVPIPDPRDVIPAGMDDLVVFVEFGLYFLFLFQPFVFCELKVQFILKFSEKLINYYLVCFLANEAFQQKFSSALPSAHQCTMRFDLR